MLETQELAKQQLEEAKKVKQSRVEAERRIEMCKLRRQLLMAWNMFVDAVMETQHNRETVCKVLCRIKHREVAQAFDCYARAVDTLVAQREKVAKTMGRWKSSGVKKAWERWEAYLKDVWQERAHEAQELAKQQLEEAAREAARLELAVLRCEDERRRWHCELTDVKAVADMAVHAAASEKAAFEELEVAVLQWEEREERRREERERARQSVECALQVCVSAELYGSGRAQAAFARLKNSVLERESASAMFLQAQILCCCCCCCCCCYFIIII
jgi:hypothetical protein